MLIRSQDKKDLINLDKVTRLAAGKVYGQNETDWLIEVERQLSIGQYSSEAKAIKVLDMIQDAYARFCAGNTYSDAVFQMPSDEEVEG